MSNYERDTRKHLRTQQLRKEKKKSGHLKNKRKPRQKNWVHENWEEWDDLEHKDTEPIMPRGEHERRRARERKILEQPQTQAEEAHPESDIPSDQTDGDKQQGLVIEVSSGLARVAVDGEIHLCTLRQALIDKDTGFTNAIAVGDEVLISANETSEPVIETILPRRSVFARRSSPDKGKISDLRQIVAANVDQILIVTSWREPHIWPELIDRYLITAQVNQLTPVLCVNKIDLVEDKEEFKDTLSAYKSLGIGLLLTSAKLGMGIQKLDQTLANRTTVLAGLSGVGKSSLLKALQPELDIRITPVGDSKKHRRQGRHTTTQSNLIPLENGGKVIDTPGIREFAVAHLRKKDLETFYPEFRRIEATCRYRDCSHIHEENCAVKSGIAEGLIHQIRYDNYRNIRCELPD